MAAMKPEAMLKELESAASSLSVKVSYEALGTTVGMGGLCRVKGKYRVIIDRRTSPRERVAMLAQSLSNLDTSSCKVSAPVRDVLAYYQLRRAS